MLRWNSHDGGRGTHRFVNHSKFKQTPLFIAGNYIGWLTTILNYTTSRFEDQILGSLTDGEALETAYHYARIFSWLIPI